ncbi:MAG TPA: hypothetical protein VFY69_07195 [Solirubrobacterales bacterium]|nr:hypothetical protein [Solirubrobacterales bacterium]
MRRLCIAVLLALLAVPALGAATASGEDFGFRPGLDGFAAAAVADGGEAATVAGSHPYQLSVSIGLNTAESDAQPGAVFPAADLRDLRIEIPKGLIVNPKALPSCTLAQFSTPRSSPFAQSRSGESCPDNTQVGTVRVQTSDGERTFGLFNLKAPPGVVAQLGFSPYGAPIVLDVELAARADGSYALVLGAENVSQRLDLHGLDLALWGIPWAASHNGERGSCLNEVEPTFPWAKCSVGEPSTYRPAAFLSLPPQCSGPLAFTARATSWQQPVVATASAVNRSGAGLPAEMQCEFLQFNPEAAGLLDNSSASSPSGFVFRLNVNHQRLTDPTYTNPSPPRRAVVELPDGTTINPSVGAGLGACAPAQFAAETAFNGQGSGCPNAAKIGVLRVRTPLFDDVLDGAVYLAQPNDPATEAPGSENPFDSLVAIYLVAKAPQRGVLVKLAGKLVPDPADGTLTATFDNLPQIPYTDLEVAFRSGQRSLLVTPPRCGYVPTQMEILPWGAGQPYDALSYTLMKTGIGGGPCPAGTPPFDPDVVSGAVNSNVNAYTPYFVRISRSDDEQEITSYSLVLPKGVTGKLAGVARCSDAAIAAARAKRGFAEAASPSCPAASQVGRTLTGYGVGSALTYTEGKVYLAGPYKGAPLSLVTINPATIGPFDLGTIVIQSAFQIDPRTAQLRIDSSASDPIPHILDGIVLHLRDIRIYVDRPEFTHNPSSCAPSRLESAITGSGANFADRGDDPVATPSTHFQLLNCRILGFQPRLGVRLRGGTRRGAYPQLRVTFAARGPNDSNLKDIAVVIPRQQFLAQEHIRSICTRVQFAARACPRNSVYGKAVAHTPLLDEPLRGNVYLRSSSGALPDLVADLYSGTVHIVLQGKIGPGRKGGIRAFFSELPDQPINRFTMTLFGGKRGLLVNSANICAKPPVSNVKTIAQNNIGAVFTTKLRGQCNRKKRGARKGRGRGGRR